MAESSNVRTLGFAILAAFVVILTVDSLAGGIASNYGRTRDLNYTIFYSNVSNTLYGDLENDTLTSGNALSNQQVSSTGTEATIFNVVWQAAKLPFKFAEAGNNIISIILSKFQLPTWFVAAIFTAIGMLILWLLVSSALRIER